MTLKQLQFFQKAAELENISKAAEELFIAQPALSKSIKDLESELGYPLFERNGKRIQLNHNGTILYKHVLHLQNNLSQMEKELKDANARKSATVTISVRVASRLLPEILKSYYEKYPDANLKIYQMNQYVKNLEDYDIVIDSEISDTASYKNRSLLLEEKILIALPVSHPLSVKKRITLSDLGGYPCSLLNEFSSLGKMVRSELSYRHFNPNIIFESDNPHMIRDFLKLNLSYSFVPEKTWNMINDFPNLILLEVEDLNLSRNIYLSYGQNEYVSHAAKEFGKHVKDFFRHIDNR